MTSPGRGRGCLVRGAWLQRRLALLLVSTVLGAGAAAQEPDVAGSRDPAGIARVARSWIVDYQRETEAQPREFVTSRVDRIRRDLRIEDELRVEAALESAIYRIPDGLRVSDVVDHYRQELSSAGSEAQALFECEGRSCGRSNDWANQVFGEAILYGPDKNQHYAALDWQGRLLSLYVIERGNRRVYAYLRVLDPSSDVEVAPNAQLVERLGQRGWVVIEGVTPDTHGRLDDGSLAALGSIAPELARVAGDDVYLVCHLRSAAQVPGSPDVLLAPSQHCAESAIEQLRGDASTGQLRLHPFGAGALLPRPGAPASRIELILPGALPHEPAP